jgi:hypothetical protein
MLELARSSVNASSDDESQKTYEVGSVIAVGDRSRCLGVAASANVASGHRLATEIRTLTTNGMKPL